MNENTTFGRALIASTKEAVAIGRGKAEPAQVHPMRGSDRRVIWPEDLSAEEIAQIARAEVPPEHAHLDAEIIDEQP